MLNKLIQFSLNNRLMVSIVFAITVIFGVYMSSTMDVDVFPDLTAPTVTVLTESHGLAPEEVERLVTFPLETALNGASFVRRVRSSSMAGISVIWVEFEWGTDIFRARQIVGEKLDGIKTSLPEEANNPTLAPNASIMGEIMLVGLTSKTLDPSSLRTIADWEVRPRLLSLGGIAHISVIGGQYKQYHILASPQKMKHYGITLSELLKAAKESSLNASGGFMNEYGNEYIVQGLAKAYTLEDIGNSVIKTIQNNPIKIKDVALVKQGAAPSIGSASINTEESVILVVLKQPDTNTIQLTNKIEDTIASIQKTTTEEVSMHTNIFKQADFINNAVNNVKKALFEGAFFVVIILFLFLMNLRTITISVVAIPISLLVSVIALKLMGFTINTMSLGGMAIAIGSLVDDAIIDVENVFKRLKQNSTLPESKQKPILTVIFEASKEIRKSILYSTLIIIAAFIPLFFLSGMEGRLLQPLGVSFVVSLAASTVVALSLTPVMCSYLLPKGYIAKRNQKEPFLSKTLSKGYKKILERTLNIPKLTLFFALLMLSFVLIVVAPKLGRSFLPEFNEGSLVISLVSVPGISLEESNKIGRMAEDIILSFPEVDIVSRRTGRAELDEHAQGVNAAEIDVPFTLKNRSKDAFLGALREKLSLIPGTNLTIGQPIGHRIDHMLSGTRANIAIKVFGPNLGTLFNIGKSIKNSVESIEGFVDVNLEQQIEIPQVQIKAKRHMLAKYGITPKQFAEFVDVAFAGEVVSQITEGQKRFNVVLKFDDKNRGKIDHIRNSLIDSGIGQKIPLHFVADIQSSTGPHTINREGVQRKVVIAGNVAGRDLGSVADDIKAVLSTSQIPDGYFVELGGQFENQEKASRQLLIASILALFVIFILLYQDFKDAVLTTIILTNLPLALIGGVVAVYLTSGIVSIASIIGFITLFGIATRNGMLLISRYQALDEDKLSLSEKIVSGSLDRLNPILMTALTTGLALLPLALYGSHPGNEIQSPMAIVILGGLISSTFLNLFVVPAVYLLVKRKKNDQTPIFSTPGKQETSLSMLLFFLGIIFCMPTQAVASNTFETVSKQIMSNHPDVKAYKHFVASKKSSYKQGLSLPNPEVSLDYLKGNSSGLSQTEFQILQAFDFPTVYGEKGRLSDLQKALIDLMGDSHYQTIQKDVHLKLIALAHAKKRLFKLKKRVKLAKDFYQNQLTQYEKGDLSIVEFNKAKIDIIKKKAELKSVQTSYQQLLNALVYASDASISNDLNVSYPKIHPLPKFEDFLKQAESKDLVLMSAQQKLDIIQQRISLQKALNLPKIELGYRHNSEPDTSFNGVHTGFTIPLGENKFKVETLEDDAIYLKTKIQNRKAWLKQHLSSLIESFNGLKTSLNEYKPILNSLDSVNKLTQAFHMGQLNLSQYYLETEFYYSTIDDYLEKEKAYFEKWVQVLPYMNLTNDPKEAQ